VLQRKCTGPFSSWFHIVLQHVAACCGVSIHKLHPHFVVCSVQCSSVSNIRHVVCSAFLCITALFQNIISISFCVAVRRHIPLQCVAIFHNTIFISTCRPKTIHPLRFEFFSICDGFSISRYPGYAIWIYDLQPEPGLDSGLQASVYV